ncbi:MAG TPA: hypothetical protein VGO11_20165 [Chthoniobacteraceae bacterium]|jgi:hypothetical protein|nr:hypothetical protein [Chthoniobacteraceae bacterium]
MKKSLSLLLLAGLAGSGWLLSTQLSARPGNPDSGYVAHEWGTFTDVQGADGVQMIWNPVVAPDLPKFVYHNTAGTNTKSSMATIQRMETPVIYFYSDRERTLDVLVNFPLGQITEWFPGKSAADSGLRLPGFQMKRSSLHWSNLKVLATNPAPAIALPKEALPTNYYAARETDASLLQVTEAGKTETEKFLFYRGVAGFQAPLTVKMEPLPSKRVILKNTGAEPLLHLFLYQVTANGGAWLGLPALAAGETRTVALPEPGGAGASELAAALREALAAEGLYKSEAAAMVKTWQAAWLEERGLRVLYTLPRAWTDRTLPLQLAPAPAKIERVMVARAEIISPAMEQALQTSMTHYLAAPTQEARMVAVEEVRELGLGRFLPSAMNRIMKPELTPEVRQSYYEVIGQLLAPKAPVVATTAKTAAR